MMEMVTGMGCQMVVTSRRQKGHYLYDSASRKRLLLPAYPTRWLDPTGADDVFAGAFLGEYKTSYDSTRALIAGCVATSLAVEGSGPFYCMDALPGLAEMRFEKMQPLVCSQ
jgi:sugar/nucleoside kinase (ribokinase family)